MVCAWCLQHGRPNAAMREPETGRWRPVSHEFARAHTLAGTASHGLCLACRPAVLKAWGLESVPAVALR